MTNIQYFNWDVSQTDKKKHEKMKWCSEGKTGTFSSVVRNVVLGLLYLLSYLM